MRRNRAIPPASAAPERNTQSPAVPASAPPPRAEAGSKKQTRPRAKSETAEAECTRPRPDARAKNVLSEKNLMIRPLSRRREDTPARRFCQYMRIELMLVSVENLKKIRRRRRFPPPPPLRAACGNDSATRFTCRKNNRPATGWRRRRPIRNRGTACPRCPPGPTPALRCPPDSDRRNGPCRPRTARS